MNTIDPKYSSYAVATEWTDDSNLEWWAKQLEIHIEDVTEEGVRRTKKDGGSVGEVFFLVVCSEQFAKRPNSEVSAEDIKKALVQRRFDETLIEQRLRSIIDSIGEVSIDHFEKKMSEHFDMTDWYS